ncbi:MAG TPA: FAD-linked oxidase C-terminal domain-containing protein [Aggregatilinea sp.]|uniref:FAD-binding and (Fe-S)-binding domain-containing protein n=1 Tax=Aggregatilinea sp. TaxID=2806333 RepID=UPI002C122FDD|nr:FAD-linked oxidase C-terminal domain-containing protein [Aggregatilinea sp.]HML20173.1 FAD-linked oxidase C-terminal domain-containing protein [Aggregatilinea sp.]
MTTPSFDSNQLEHDLKRALGGDVSFDQMTRLLYSTDASNYKIEPIGVVRPKDADDVAATHAITGQYGVPLLPRGGGSSLAGQTVGHAVVMDFSHYMRRVVGINAEARTVRVQPGVVLGQLNAQLAPLGLMVGPDPASGERATVGGCVGNNATGMHSILYGMFGDHVRGVEAVLADGERVAFGKDAPTSARRQALEAQIARIVTKNSDEIARRFPKTWRTVAGYALNKLDPTAPDLARLFTGSEGTLGTVIEVELGLVPRPVMTRQVLLHYDDLRAALEAVPAILETNPSAVELLDRMLIHMTRAHIEFSRHLTFVVGDPAAVLVVEYYGERESELASKVERLQQHMAAGGYHGSTVIASTAAQMSDVLKVRKAGLGLLMSMRSANKPVAFIEDAAVPVEHLPDYVEGVERIVTEAGTSMAIYAHASAGCLHIRPLIDLKTVEGLKRYRTIAEGALALAIHFEGTTSGEHGEGLSRGEFSEKLFGPQITGAFRQVKAAFDPHNRMNPGKIVYVGPMDDPATLRYGPAYSTPLAPPRLRLDWSADGGYPAAVEMCNGAGVCRKEDTGIMCPSFMATRSERDSTRGRANALRLAMSGALGLEGLADKRVYDVLDLCLSCKACKAECPSGVDMARLKTEFTASYQDAHGIPLRSRLFGNIHRMNRLGSLMPAAANAVLSSSLTRRALERVGITTRRQLPLLARERFSTWAQNHPLEGKGGARAPILISDTYTEYNYPYLGQAVMRVAQALEQGVEVWGPGQIDCCGRPLISKGLLDQAWDLAAKNVRRMAPVAARGERFMIVEPSCAAAFRDEYPDLVPHDLRTDAQAVASAVITVEEWAAEAAESGLFAGVAFDSAPHKVLLHGHCYQRSLWGTGAAHRMLALLPNLDISELDDGCCGVAGSFGYEAEHYDLSVQIGEQRLLPAVRAASDAIVAASGVSCREQIRHGTGREALHPIEIVAMALGAGNE